MAAKTKNNLSPTHEHMQEIIEGLNDAQRLQHWNELVENVNAIDPSLAIAIDSGRGSVVKAFAPRPLTAEEAKLLFHLVGVMIETNQALQQHAQQTAELVNQWVGHFKGMFKTARMIESFAHFKNLHDEEDDE